MFCLGQNDFDLSNSGLTSGTVLVICVDHCYGNVGLDWQFQEQGFQCWHTEEKHAEERHSEEAVALAQVTSQNRITARGDRRRHTGTAVGTMTGGAAGELE